jgi:hypothetical protein
LASLGGLVSLEKLNMKGCRGKAWLNEAKVWQAIQQERARRKARKDK